MARLLAGATIYVFDIDMKSQEICRSAAGLNGVSGRISVAGQCTPDLLQAIVPRGRTPVVMCDCEGREGELIDPQRVPALRSATLIVECHDFIDASITQTLADRLAPSHNLGIVREGARSERIRLPVWAQQPRPVARGVRVPAPDNALAGGNAKVTVELSNRFA